jgi:adenosylmethionine-8-amino-7-oxononanoate aminotransferase
VITGFGPSGQPFGSQVFKLKPDLVTRQMLTSDADVGAVCQ